MNFTVKETVVKDLGLISYEDAYRIQKEHVQKVIEGSAPAIFLCEHPTILTCGRMSKPESLLWTKDEVFRAGSRMIDVDRGGDVTLHSPGQLVCYPVLNLNLYGKDLHAYLHMLEETIIATLDGIGIHSSRNDLNTGVWVEGQKIASIGIGVKKWVSYHGLCLNVSNDLSLYKMIRPCGLDVEMTSISSILDRKLSIDLIKPRLVDSLTLQFKLK